MKEKNQVMLLLIIDVPLNANVWMGRASLLSQRHDDGVSLPVVRLSVVVLFLTCDLEMRGELLFRSHSFLCRLGRRSRPGFLCAFSSFHVQLIGVHMRSGVVIHVTVLWWFLSAAFCVCYARAVCACGGRESDRWMRVF